MPKFRKLKLEDEKEVKKLLNQLTENKIRLNIKSLIKDEGINCVVLENNGRVIGFGSLVVHQVPSKGFVARIEEIAIDRDSRNQGYGRKLLKELIKIAKRKKIKIINLTSSPKRIEARKLYKSMGFKLLDTGVFKLEL